MAKIIAVEPQAAPRIAQTSATSAARAPSPPSSVGISMPSSSASRIASNASCGKARVAIDRVGELLGDLGGRFGAGDEITRARRLAGAGAKIAMRKVAEFGVHGVSSSNVAITRGQASSPTAAHADNWRQLGSTIITDITISLRLRHNLIRQMVYLNLNRSINR